MEGGKEERTFLSLFKPTKICFGSTKIENSRKKKKKKKEEEEEERDAI